MGMSLFATLLSLAFATVSPLVGAWESAQTFGHGLTGGTLQLVAKGAWIASIGGQTASAPIAHTASAVTFRFEDGSEMILRTDRSTITGQWIQPATITYGEAYATPVVLSKRSPNAWVGDVRPVADVSHF